MRDTDINFLLVLTFIYMVLFVAGVVSSRLPFLGG